MNDSIIDSFFHYSSKIIIVIPILLVIIAVVIKGGQNKENNSLNYIAPTVTVSPTGKLKELDPVESTIAAKLTLKGTFSCFWQDRDKTIQLVVDNGQVFGQYKDRAIDQKGILQKDCLYSWDKDLKGIKMCNLGIFISLIENNKLSELIKNPMVLSFIKGRETEIIKLLNLCQPNNKPDQGVFRLPVNIKFEAK